MRHTSAPVSKSGWSTREWFTCTGMKTRSWATVNPTLQHERCGPLSQRRGGRLLVRMSCSLAWRRARNTRFWTEASKTKLGGGWWIGSAGLSWTERSRNPIKITRAWAPAGGSRKKQPPSEIPSSSVSAERNLEHTTEYEALSLLSIQANREGSFVGGCTSAG